MIDACCTHSNGTESYQILHNLEKLLPINMLKSEFCDCNSFKNKSGSRSAYCGRIVTKIAHSKYPRNPRDHWTKVHQIFKQRSGIIVAINACICMAILQFVVERQSKEWTWSILTSANGPKIYWLRHQRSLGNRCFRRMLQRTDLSKFKVGCT